MIFMTDGEMNADNLVYSSYGIEFHDKRTTADGASNADSIHNSRFLAVCQATKAKGIRVWVIAFASALTTTLQSCASDKSAFLVDPVVVCALEFSRTRTLEGYKVVLLADVPRLPSESSALLANFVRMTGSPAERAA